MNNNIKLSIISFNCINLFILVIIILMESLFMNIIDWISWKHIYVNMIFCLYWPCWPIFNILIHKIILLFSFSFIINICVTININERLSSFRISLLLSRTFCHFCFYFADIYTKSLLIVLMCLFRLFILIIF